MKTTKNTFLQWLLKGFRKLHLSEEGQALVFSVISVMFLLFFTISVFRIGYISSTKMKVQGVADAAAYSMALNQADALSALAWINDGIAQTQYHMSRYAVEVIVRGVDLEFAKPTSPYATNSYKLTREPDPNVNASNAQTAYDNAYQRAQQNIPDGKRLIKQLNDLQEKILEDTAAKIRDAGVDKELGAAFSMTVGRSGQRGAERAAIFPDVDELDPNLYVEREIDMTRFGIAHGVVPSMHPNDQGLPRWTDWFDSGLRGVPFYSNGVANYRYWDSDRSFSVPNGRGGRTFVGVIRTFARHGRIYTPYAAGQRINTTYLTEEVPPGMSEEVNLGRGYEIGDTILEVANLHLLRDRSGPNGQPQPENAGNPYMLPFYAIVSGSEVLKPIYTGPTIEGITLSFSDNGANPDTITDSRNGFVRAGLAPGQTITVTGSSSNDGTYKIQDIPTLVSSGISFEDNDPDPDTISDSGSGFLSADFEVGQRIRVKYSTSNNRTTTIDQITAGTITLRAGDDLNVEAAGRPITIQLSPSSVTSRRITLDPAETLTTESAGQQVKIETKFRGTLFVQQREVKDKFGVTIAVEGEFIGSGTFFGSELRRGSLVRVRGQLFRVSRIVNDEEAWVRTPPQSPVEGISGLEISEIHRTASHTETVVVTNVVPDSSNPNESNGTVTIESPGLQNIYWIWFENDGSVGFSKNRTPGETWWRNPGESRPNDDYSNVTNYFHRSHPRFNYGRKLFYNDSTGPKEAFKRIYLGFHPPTPLTHVQTRAPCWDSREIRVSEEAPGKPPMLGPTGYIVHPSKDQVIPCPTCGGRYRQGVDYDGDRFTDVVLFARDAFHLQGTNKLDEDDFMDTRIFREMNEYDAVDRFGTRLEDDAFAEENEVSYGEESVESPLVLTEEIFKWGINVGVWMPDTDFRVLPSGWDPTWGFFCFASARPAVFDGGRWVIDWELLADDPARLAARQSWLASNSNHYLTQWQARLTPTGRTIKDMDATEKGFDKGLNLILDKLLNSVQTYTQTGISVADPLSNKVQGLIRAPGQTGNSQDKHGLQIDDKTLDEITNH